MFNQQSRSRQTTQVIEKPENIDGFFDLSRDDQLYVQELIEFLHSERGDKAKPPKNKRANKSKSNSKSSKSSSKSGPRVKIGSSSSSQSKSQSKSQTKSKSGASAAPAAKDGKKKRGSEGGRRDIGRIIML
jgi:hypothetical protein